MKLINRDLTRESLKIYVSGHQIYAKIFHKSHGKWEVDEYFKEYNLIDQKLVQTYILENTIKYIYRIWGLKNPKLSINL